MDVSEPLEITLSNNTSALERSGQTLSEFGRRHGLSPRVVHDLTLALEEILTNIIAYGYPDDREHQIRVTLRAQQGEVRIDVEDTGRPFNPLDAPEPDTTKPLEDRTAGGLGIFLVRTLMDDVEYSRRGNRNLLTLRKRTHHG